MCDSPPYNILVLYRIQVQDISCLAICLLHLIECTLVISWCHLSSMFRPLARTSPGVEASGFLGTSPYPASDPTGVSDPICCPSSVTTASSFLSPPPLLVP